MWKGKTGNLNDDPKLVAIYIKMMNKIFSIIMLTTIMSGLTPLCTNMNQILMAIGVPMILSIYQVFKLYKVMLEEYLPYLFNDF